MLGNYTFQRYQDTFLIGNSDVQPLSYSLTESLNCGSSNPVYSSGVVNPGTTGFLLNIPVDGDYTLTLTRGADSVDIVIRNYYNLQKSLIANLVNVICGNSSCEDCGRQGLDDCVDYQGVFSQIIGYQYLIKPYYSDYCTECDILSNFIAKSIDQNRCNISSQLYNELYNEAMTGKILNAKALVLYLAAIYYLTFYFYERLLAADDTERAYVDAKFFFPTVQVCINRKNILNISTLQTLFTSQALDCNTAPTVGDVTRTLTALDLGEQTYTFSQADFTNNFADPDGDHPNMVKLLNNVFTGALYYNNLLINGEQFTFPIADANRLQYKYTVTETNLTYDKLFFQVSDDNPSPKYSNMATFNIAVTAYVNQPPDIVGNNSITVSNRVNRVFTLADFTTGTTPAYHDPEGDGLYQLRVDSLPSLGQLKLSGTAVTIGQIINASAISAGSFTYAAPNQDAAASVSFNFSLADTGSHTFIS